jgi:hypothetical protein
MLSSIKMIDLDQFYECQDEYDGEDDDFLEDLKDYNTFKKINKKTFLLVAS